MLRVSLVALFAAILTGLAVTAASLPPPPDIAGPGALATAALD